VIDVEARIRAAATDETLRAAAAAIWKRVSPTLFDPHDERNGLRVSDAGQCVRSLWAEIHVAPKVFTPDVQLFNLDEGTLTGAWFACLLEASLEADGYAVELEPEVSLNGTPGHIDLFFRDTTDGKYEWEREEGVVEFKRTNQSWSIKAPHEPNKSGETKRYHILQLMAYCAAKGVNDGAIVTIAPSWDGKMRVDWYELDDWRDAVAGEQMRLSAALGPVEPEGDAAEGFRCRGCPVIACSRNPLYDNTASQLERSLA
jgi:hypothetical protein